MTSTDGSLQKCWEEKQKDGAVATGGNGIKTSRLLVRLVYLFVKMEKIPACFIPMQHN